MALFKLSLNDHFVPFEKMPFPDLEKALENWIEANPQLLFENETIAIFGRQPRTQFGKYLDLLGVDRTGATVVIELKVGATPRDVVAQTLEYAAWADSLSADQLDEVARQYAQRKLLGPQTLADFYRRTFAVEEE